jgi:hypothetical protein
MPNQATIREIGLDAFLTGQAERIEFLEIAIKRYDDGRSKNFYCIAAALLSAESLKESLHRANESENLRDVLNAYAIAEGEELKLRK